MSLPLPVQPPLIAEPSLLPDSHSLTLHSSGEGHRSRTCVYSVTQGVTIAQTRAPKRSRGCDCSARTRARCQARWMQEAKASRAAPVSLPAGNVSPGCRVPATQKHPPPPRQASDAGCSDSASTLAPTSSPHGRWALTVPGSTRAVLDDCPPRASGTAKVTGPTSPQHSEHEAQVTFLFKAYLVLSEEASLAGGHRGDAIGELAQRRPASPDSPAWAPPACDLGTPEALWQGHFLVRKHSSPRG